MGLKKKEVKWWPFLLEWYEGESKSNAILFRTGIITNTGTCIIYQNETGPLWITSLLLHSHRFSQEQYSTFEWEHVSLPVKFCWLFFETRLHYRFHFLVTGIIFASLQLQDLIGKHLKVEHCCWEKRWLWRSRDVIHRGPSSFWCMIYVPVLVIIPVLNKMALLFDTPSYYKLLSIELHYATLIVHKKEEEILLYIDEL